MDFSEINLAGVIVGAFIGVVIMFLIEKLMGNKHEAESNKKIENQNRENEKLRRRIAECESEIGRLNGENQKLSRLNDEKGKNQEDLLEELNKEKKECKTLRLQNDELRQTIKEYKLACESYKEEIAHLKREL